VLISNFVQISLKCDEDVVSDRQPFRDESMSCIRRSRLIETENGDTSEEQGRKHAHNFLWHQGNRSQRIRPGRTNSQLYILHYDISWRMREDFSQNFGDKRTVCCNMTTHRLTLPLSLGIFWPKSTRLSSHTHSSFHCLLMGDKTERPPFWHKWRIAVSSEHPRRTRLPGGI
jgi:hypothetical protein